MFNLSVIDCKEQDAVHRTFECALTHATVYTSGGNPDPDNPNCSLDLSFETYSMSEIQEGVLTGITETSACFNTILTIDRHNQRVYKSFTKTKDADKYKQMCGMLPRTEVLMNCTAYPRIRKGL